MKRPALRYHGSKWVLAPWIVSHFKEHRIYTEAFGGGASVLMRKSRSYSEVYNDSWGALVNVFRMLRDRPDDLYRVLRLTPYSREEFDNCTPDALQKAMQENPVEAARIVIYRGFSGFGSASSHPEYNTVFRGQSNNGNSKVALAWAQYPDHIKAWTERLRGVVLENADASYVIQYYDQKNCLHYVDPPYPKSTRGTHAKNGDCYHEEMTDQQHRDLAKVLRDVKGMVVLSGYDCPLYDELYGDWKQVRKNTLADGAAKRTEVLWINPAGVKSPSLFD